MKDLLLVDVESGASNKRTLSGRIQCHGLWARVKHLRTDAKDHFALATRGQSGELAWAKPIDIPKPAVGGSAYPTGVCAQSDDAIRVLSSRGNCVYMIESASGKVLQEVPVGVAPYAICCPRPDLCYVTNWGGNRPTSGDPQANSSRTPARWMTRHRQPGHCLGSPAGEWQVATD